MASWELKRVEKESSIELHILRDGKFAGHIKGEIGKAFLLGKYCKITGFRILPAYQREFMLAHKDLKMGEHLSIELIKALGARKIRLIEVGHLTMWGDRLIKRLAGEGIAKSTLLGYVKVFPEKINALSIEKLTLKLREADKIKTARILRNIRKKKVYKHKP